MIQQVGNVFITQLILVCHSWAQWSNSFKKDSIKAAEIYEKNCFERNHGESCFSYASLMLFGGNGIRRDSLLAYRGLEHGCKEIKNGHCCMVSLNYYYCHTNQ